MENCRDVARNVSTDKTDKTHPRRGYISIGAKHRKNSARRRKARVYNKSDAVWLGCKK